MKNNIKCVISFIVGAGAGVYAGYKLYERNLTKFLLQVKEEEEAKSKEDISAETEVETEEVKPDDIPKTTPKKRNYSKKAEKAAPSKPVVKKGNKSVNEDIDVIPEVDFDNINIAGWNVEYLTMYKDGVVERDNGDILESPMDYIGEEAYNVALDGECTICVRNFTTKCDYKIDCVSGEYYSEEHPIPDDTID